MTGLLEELARPHAQAILFGEVFGSKVQNLNYGRRGEFGFAAFDALVDGRYLDAPQFLELCRKHIVPTVPVLHHGTFSLEPVKRLAEGPTTLGGGHVREGVVVRPVKERVDPKVGRAVLKYMGDGYLFAKGVTDTNDG